MLAPFGEHVGATRVLGRALAERQTMVASALGIAFGGEVDEAGRDPGTLYWDDDVDVTPAALRAWLRVADSGAQMAIAERPLRVGEVEVEPRVEIPGRDRVEIARAIGLRWGVGDRPVLVPVLGLDGKTRLAGPFDAEIPWHLTARSATTIRHWMHAIRANLSALAAETWSRLFLQPWNLAWTWARYPMRRPFAVVGRGCEIHPSATLDACILGDRVKIGAHTSLRGTFVGDGAEIEDQVSVRGSVIEAGAHLANKATVNLSVLGAQSSVGHWGMQASIVGRKSFVSTICTIQDLNLRGNVRVRMEGRLVDTGIPFVGCAIGHGVRLGAGFHVAAGREIPSGVSIVTTDGVLSRVPEGIEAGEYVFSEGTLRRG
jgi:acetyltransferase-like isoleucine patch superfamily enzyme